MGRFIITKSIVDKIKKIKNNPNVLIESIVLNHPLSKIDSNADILRIEKDKKKIASALIGSNLIKGESVYTQGSGEGQYDWTVFKNIDDQELIKKTIANDILIFLIKRTDKTKNAKQDIKVPLVGKVIDTSNPSVKKAGEVQSIIFNRQFWTVSKAKDWINKHPQFKIKKIDMPADGKTIRFRQQDPKDFSKFRIKNIGDGNIKLVLGFK